MEGDTGYQPQEIQNCKKSQEMEGDRAETDLYLFRWKKLRPKYEIAKK